MARLLLFFALLAAASVKGQRCPITEQRANTMRFTGVKQSCGRLNAAETASCDACLCSITDAVVPELQAAGFDMKAAGGFAGAESVLQACMMTLAAPLAAAGYVLCTPPVFSHCSFSVPLTSLLRLTQCPFDAQRYPSCISGYVSEIPEPMADPAAPPEAEESFVEEVATACLCSPDFDPVCDYNGFWYTNYCVAKCKGAKLVEKCYPVFKAIEIYDEPFVLYEKDAPLLWKAGCFCPQDDEDFDPVCDIDGIQYPSPCYANCLGVPDVFDCRALVVDFVLSGEGPIVEPPKVKGQSGEAPDTPKPPVDLDPPSPTLPPSPVAPGPSTPTITPEAAALFQQLDVDVSAFPPELVMMAYGIIMGDQTTDAELERAQELLSDEESMHDARSKLSPVAIAQLEAFAATATGNNKQLLDELVDTLKATPTTEKPSPPQTDKEALRKCLNSCKQHKPVCSAKSGEEYASACHARCNGVTATKPCYYHHESGAAAVTASAVCGVLTLLGAVAAANM